MELYSSVCGQLQTVRAALRPLSVAYTYRRERWETMPHGIPDGDFIDVDFVDNIDPCSPLIILLHGLEGSSRSHYALTLMSAIQEIGWMGAIPHFRGCSGENNLLPRAYHSGDAVELDWIIKRIAALHPNRALFVCGVSLGGNVLLVWLGSHFPATQLIKGAAAISVPFDLEVSVDTLSKGFNLLYTRHFLRTMKQKALSKNFEPSYQELIRQARTIGDFDEAFTAPFHGFKDARDYWTKASSKSYLSEVGVPTLLMNAQNDPFFPAELLPNQDQVSKCIQLHQPLNGGHVGFDDKLLSSSLIEFFRNCL
jgi:uncharacterized protein